MTDTPDSLASPAPPGSPRRLALVTGGAHRLGLAIAAVLAGAGFDLLLHYHRSGERLADAVAHLQSAGAAVVPVQADLSAPSGINQVLGALDALGRPLSVLVNSAAVMPRQPMGQVDPQAWDATLALNLRAPMLLGQAAGQRMAEHGGLIVNITDAGANKAWTGFPAYIVSKAALETLTRLQARAFAPSVRVNAVAPGLILPSADLPEGAWERLVGQVPLRRAGRPEEVAQAVLFLWQNPYITGQTLVIDGGFQLR